MVDSEFRESGKLERCTIRGGASGNDDEPGNLRNCRPQRKRAKLETLRTGG